jgi:hypothetical protein
MTTYADVAIVIARCIGTKAQFGMRWQTEDTTAWLLTWAFRIGESASTREGYAVRQISGALAIDSAYPGCPDCKARSFFVCGGCRHLTCRTGTSRTVTCAWCGQSGELFGTVSGLQASQDR